MRPAFPLLVANALAWAAARRRRRPVRRPAAGASARARRARVGHGARPALLVGGQPVPPIAVRSAAPPARSGRWAAGVALAAAAARMAQLPPAVDHMTALLGGRLTFAHPAGCCCPGDAGAVLAAIGARWPIFRRGSWRCRRRCARWCLARPSRWPDRSSGGPRRRVSVVALADVSDSVSDEALAFERASSPRWPRAAAGRGDPPPRVVRFAAAPRGGRLRGTTGIALRGPPPGGAATDPALAVGLGAGLVDATRRPAAVAPLRRAGHARRSAAPRPRAWAARARRSSRSPACAGAPATPPWPSSRAPDDVRPACRSRVDVRVHRRPRDRRAPAAATAAGPTTVDDPDRAHALSAGATTVSYQVRVAATRDDHPAGPRAASSDRRPENDEGVLAVADRGPHRASSVSKGRPAPPGRSRTRSPPQAIVPTSTRRGPAPPATSAGIDLVVLADVPRAALWPTRRWPRWKRSCAPAAGCWSAGGTQSFGPGGYARRRAWRRCCPCAWTSPRSRRRPPWRWRW